MDIRPLAAGDFDAVHAAFVDAFGDYAVPLQMSPAELEEMLRRRGWVPDASVGVFDAGRLVAFTLNGIGRWRGALTGYDTGTGVIPSHRGRGLSRLMIGAAVERLLALGAVQYLLEVLQSNERAFRVYRDAGFEVTRALQCWSLPASGTTCAGVRETADLDLAPAASFFDAEPSWQNSVESVARAAAPRRTLTVERGGATAGFAVVFENGDLPLLAVAPGRRRHGIGRDLLLAAAAATPLRIVNVDPAVPSLAAFLESCGATKTVAQWEMLKPLQR